MTDPTAPTTEADFINAQNVRRHVEDLWTAMLAGIETFATDPLSTAVTEAAIIDRLSDLCVDYGLRDVTEDIEFGERSNIELGVLGAGGPGFDPLSDLADHIGWQAVELPDGRIELVDTDGETTVHADWLDAHAHLVPVVRQYLAAGDTEVSA